MKQRNKHSYTTEGIQDRLIPILSEIDKVCREHNLRYYLWAGTQLGAIRHKGFIPWDDDADIAMPRADYKILMEHADEWLSKPFEIATASTTDRYPHYFARLQDSSTTMVIRKHLKYVEGIHIDIFPLDNVPDDERKRRRHFKKLNVMYKLLYMAMRSTKKDSKVHKKLFYGFMHRITDRKKLLDKIERFIQRYNDQDCANCTDSFYGAKAFVAHTTLGTPTKYEFAGLELMGVENADRYLSEKYGDYMTLPKECDRRQHSVDYLNYELPYRQFDIETIM